MPTTIKEIKQSSVRPKVAYPTIFVFGLATSVYLLTILLNSTYVFPEFKSFDFDMNKSWIYWISSILFGILSFVITTVISYTQFTIAHDAIHRSISSKYPFYNDLIGYIAQWFLGPTNNWWILKQTHLEHHAHTNDEEKDPDYWCSLKGPGGKYLTPFRWATMDISYLHLFLKNNFWRKSFKNKILALAPFLVTGAVMYGIILSGTFWFWFQHWILPSRVAVFILAYAFDFLPHYPHDIKREEDPFKTTSYLYIPWILRPFLSILTFYQVYHIAHHLHPTVPFYKYKEVWNKAKKDLVEEGVPIRDILPEIVNKKFFELIGDDEYSILYKTK